MKAMNEERFAIVVSAPSGTGKTTIIQNVIQESTDYEFVISTTTRPRRANEENDKNYYFLSKEEFKKIIEEDGFIEWAFVHGNYYGITKKEIDRIQRLKRIPIFDVDVQGAATLRKILPNAVFIYIVPPSLEVLQQRLRGRGTDSEEQIQLRLKNAVEELKCYSYYDYIIINNTIEESCKCFHAILKAEFCKMKRMENKIKEILSGVAYDYTAR
ncbi:MAG: guanylate kinase [Spirochaetes bacterium]|nr:guanylate kinase [Spirochaetota bacterium]